MQLLPLYKAKKVTFFMVEKKYLVIFANIIFGIAILVRHISLGNVSV